jgi:hypothetical protein
MMTFLWRPTIAGLAGAALLLSAGAVSAEDSIIYRWVDDNGGVHFTQGRENIPPPHRSRAVPLGSVGGEQSSGPAPAPAERQPEPQPPPPPPLPTSQRKPPPPSAPERIALDELLTKAGTADEYLVIGEAYLRLGLPLATKTCADKAALVAATSGEWARVADAYAAIGQAAASNEARNKSEQLRQQERALQNLSR